MGKDSRARRRERAEAGRGGHSRPNDERGGQGQTFGLHDDRPPAEDRGRRDVDWIITQAMHALDLGLVGRADDAAVTLAQWCDLTDGRQVVVSTLVAELARATTEAWERGWQPSDVHRLAGRRLSDAEQSIVVDVMSMELDGYAPSTVDHRWLAQLQELDGRVWWPRSRTWLAAHRDRGTDWLTLLSQVLAVLHLLTRLPRLERLTPLPGTVVPPTDIGPRRRPDEGPAVDRPVADERILSRIRQLLAKAESTTFEAEAETFTAGAQALMARHSIDAALLAADAASGTDVPDGRRIGIDNPYEGPKAMLLDAVAAANRCRMVWSRELGFGTVVGFAADLEYVEVLFTSLLVQATHALTSAGSRSDSRGRSRTRAFRQSFLTAYAGRIGERLKDVTAAEVDTAAASVRTTGRELVPLLAARAEEVDRAIDDWFPVVKTRSVGAVRDAEGWHSGRAAADKARLGAGSAIDGAR